MATIDEETHLPKISQKRKNIINDRKNSKQIETSNP